MAKKQAGAVHFLPFKPDWDGAAEVMATIENDGQALEVALLTMRHFESLRGTGATPEKARKAVTGLALAWLALGFLLGMLPKDFFRAVCSVGGLATRPPHLAPLRRGFFFAASVLRPEERSPTPSFERKLR